MSNPFFEDEIYFALSRLRKYYSYLCKSRFGILPPKESFNRFLFDNMGESVIPHTADTTILEREILDDLPFKPNLFSDKDVERYIKETREILGYELYFHDEKDWVKNTHTSLRPDWCALFCYPIKELVSDLLVEIEKERLGLRRGSTNVTMKKGKLVSLTTGRGKVVVNNTVFNRLKKLYRGKRFTPDTYSMLRRYDSIFGDSRPYEGGGHHSAVPPQVLDVMRTTMGVDCECFANPMNHYLPNYHSVFLDTDSPFGSRGNFFSSMITTGRYEANPPFVEEVMSSMVDKMETDCDEGYDLVFVIVLPHWDDAGSIQRIKNSPYLSTWSLNKKGHSFVSGLKHKTKLQQFNSVHDTFVAILDSEIRDWSAEMKQILNAWK